MASFDDRSRAPTSDGNAAFGFGVSVTVGVRIAQSPGGPDGGSGTDGGVGTDGGNGTDGRTDGGGPAGGGPGTIGTPPDSPGPVVGPMACGMVATLSNAFW